MVLPLIGAALGAGGSIISAILGGDAQDEAAKYNYAASIYNTQQQERARQDALAQADRTDKEGKKGGYDAYGNHTYWDPQRGWVTDLSDQQQNLLNYFYSQEMPEQRAQFQREATRSRTEDDQATQLLDQFRRVDKQSPQELENQLYEKASRGIAEAGNTNMEAALRQAARTGNTNTGSLISEFTRQAMDARANAAKDAALQAKDYTSNAYAKERGDLASLYTQFASQGGARLAPSYDTSGIGKDNALLSAFMNQNAQGNSQQFNAAAMTGGLREPIQPNNSAANTAAAIGGSLSSMFGNMGSYFDKQQNNALLQSFLTSGGQFDLGGGGIFGKAADRLVSGSGGF